MGAEWGKRLNICRAVGESASRVPLTNIDLGRQSCGRSRLTLTRLQFPGGMNEDSEAKLLINLALDLIV